MSDLNGAEANDKHPAAGAHGVEFEGLEEEEEDEDVFIIPRKPTIESLKRWRQATLALNAARRFRYTLDLKASREDQAREMLRIVRNEDDIPSASLKRQLSKFRTGAHVLRAVRRFREAGARAREGRFQTPPEGFAIGPDNLRVLVQNTEFDRYQALGGVAGIAKALNSDLEQGITDDPEDIQKRWDGFGENKFAKRKHKGFLSFVWDACQDTTLIILMVCAAVALASGMKADGPSKGWYDGTAIGFAVILVIFVTALSDYKQSLQFRSLNDEKENILIQVVRGGRRIKISIFQLAVGDIVTLNIGDQIPADGLFVSGRSLTVDESSMTGESDPVHKDVKHPFFMGGCKCVDGNGTMLVTGVGMNTEWGQVMATLSEDNGEETPLQVRLNGAATFIGQIGLTVAVLVLIISLIRYFVLEFKDDKEKGTSAVITSVVDIFTIAVTIVVVAVPEGLPLAVTLTLAYSMRKMMADKSLVRKLAACETMGSATTICSDKTGTLTLNQMTVVKCWVAGVLRELDQVKSLKAEVFTAVVDGIGLNTVGYVFFPEGSTEAEVSGSPTEAACLSWGLKIGMNFNEVRSRSTVLQVETFSSAKKRAGVAAKLESGIVRVFWKGAAEIILSESKHWLDDQGSVHQLTPEKVVEIQNVIDGMAAASLRCVAFAYRDLDPASVPSGDDLESWTIPDNELTFLVVVGIKDPCRPGVREAVAVCQAAGVKVRMVTGDNVVTAKAIAEECGILTPGGIVVEGRDFRNFTEEQFKRILPNLDVMARSSPTDKLLLVTKLKEESPNSVVAVTGDGTNDAPALHQADIGLSMGISGTEVAKEASDIIILDDNFASVVKVVRWGRSVYANIQKFIQFQLTVNVTALVINFVAACSSNHVPLNSVQLLWVNLIMDTLGALALATEAPTDDLMMQKPVGRSEPLITNVMWRNLISQAIYQVVLLLTFNFAGEELFNNKQYRVDGLNKKNNTIIFNTFVFCQIFNEFNARHPVKLNVFAGILKNRIFIGVIAISILFQVVLVQFLGKFASTSKLTWSEWLICIALGAVSLPLGFLVKLIPVREKPWFDAKNIFKQSSKRKLGSASSRGGAASGSSKGGVSSRKSSKSGSSKGEKAELISEMQNGEAHDEDGGHVLKSGYQRASPV